MRFLFIDGIQQLLSTVKVQSSESIKAAITICSNTIKKGRIVNLFGAGHSSLPCMEAFPRIGSFVGFNQITEPFLGFNGFVTGKGGQRQMSFFEQTSAFASVIFENYEFVPDDTLIVFSHSGINALPIEMIEEANKRGMHTIAVLSKEHANSQNSKAPSGKRLNEVAECVIDTYVPAHDAIVEVGNNERSGGASTVISMVIMNTIVSETAKVLIKDGFNPVIYPSHNVSENINEVLAKEKLIFDRYKRLIAKL